MTVETDLDRAQYATNATTGPWTVPFYFLANDELIVTYTSAAGVDTTLTLNVDFSVTGAGDPTGGTVTTTTAYAAGGRITILRDMDLVQETEYVDGDSFPAKAHERALDRLTMIAQQLREKINRALTLPSSDSNGGELPPAASRAGLLLGFDGSGAIALIAAAAQSAAALALSLLGNAGSTFVSFLQSGIGAVLQTLQDKGQQHLHVFDFMTAAQKADVRAGTLLVDVTTPVQAAITEAATSGRELIFEGPMLVGAIATAANDIRWVGKKGARFVQKPAVYGLATWHVSVTGDRPYIRDIVFDGNQAAMISTQGSGGLLVPGKSPTVVGVTCKSYNGVGCQNTSANGGLVTGNVKRGAWIDSHFDDNAGLGVNTIAANYHSYMGCTFDRNGYGFQKTRANYADTSHGFVAFGIAIRMRSHHLDFIGCSARDNGRDGFDVNQGSYAIKFAQCLAYGNDDGGFTIASDATGTGLPGESEACYDIEYIDCESYNNYSGGLVAYQPAHNVTVIGGRFYNNHRLAGNLAAAASYRHGIYFAAGSTGIKVDTKAYDDRQFRPITGVAGGVLTATGWVAGDRLFYPKVAIYSANQVLQGYGQITAESAGSVTITPTAQGGVTLGSITAGMYVTQAVQHSGVTADNNCQGTISVDGFGHHPSISDGGRNAQSGGFSAGQNILIGNEKLEDFELLVNPSWDASTATGWTYSLTGGGTTAADAVICRSAQALSLVAGSSAAQGDATLVTGALSAMLGEFVEFSVWAYSLARGQANIYLFWNPGAGLITTTYTHPGGGWKLMKIGAQIPTSTTQVLPRIESVIGATVKWDTASLKVVRSHIDQRETAPTSRYLAV